jgi:hypothetical protein
MTTTLDLGTKQRPQMLRCELIPTNLYTTFVLALRDFRSANGRDETTGDGHGNASWVAMALGMIVLDTLSGPAGQKVGQRWTQLLTTHKITPADAHLIYKLRCSLLHGYGIPKPSDVNNRRLILNGDPAGHAVDTDQPGLAIVSVPIFCSFLVERIAVQAKMSWDVSLIDTNIKV